MVHTELEDEEQDVEIIGYKETAINLWEEFGASKFFKLKTDINITKSSKQQQQCVGLTHACTF